MAEIIVKAENVTKYYKMGHVVVKALNGVSLEIPRGAFVVIIGPSGSGKSTLMHLLGALDRPTSGTVEVGGKKLGRMDNWERAMLRRKKIGFVFQAFNLIPTLNTLENVMIPTEPTDEDKDEVMLRAKRLLKEVDLADRMTHKPSELSGGQRQRVSIARALINGPEIVFADEPTGNLDSKTGQTIIRLMQRLNKVEGKTFIIVTHDPDMIQYATHTVRIRDGLIVENNHKKPKEA